LEPDVIEVRHLRSRDADDYAAVLEIRMAVFVEEQNVPREHELDEYEAESDFFLARLDGESVATGRLRREGLQLKFERIATLAPMRERGIGAVLMEAMHAFGERHHPAHLQLLHGQIPAIGFYEKLGWVALGEVFVDEKIEHRIMIRPPPDRAARAALLVWNQPADMEPAVREYLESLNA
jgi:predicted GNAT family N-acyltransferase